MEWGYRLCIKTFWAFPTFDNLYSWQIAYEYGGLAKNISHQLRGPLHLPSFHANKLAPSACRGHNVIEPWVMWFPERVSQSPVALEAVPQSEVRQRRRNSVWHPLHVESKKKWYNRTYLQNRKRFTRLENKFMVTGWEEGGKGQLGSSGWTVYTAVF